MGRICFVFLSHAIIRLRTMSPTLKVLVFVLTSIVFHTILEDFVPFLLYNTALTQSGLQIFVSVRLFGGLNVAFELD